MEPAGAAGEGRRGGGCVKHWAWTAGLALVITLGLLAWAEAAPKELTLEEAIRRGIAMSPDMRRAELRLEAAALEWRRAEVNARATVPPVEMERIKQALERAQLEVQLARVATALYIERLYYDVLQARDTLLLRESATERAMQQLDIARRRHASGQLTELQLREGEQTLAAAELAEREAQHRLHMARMALQRATGLDGEDIVLTEEVDMTPEAVDVERDIAGALERRLELLFARRAVEEAQRAVELADNDYTPRIEWERARIALAEAELAYREEEERVRREVWASALALVEAEGRHALALQQLDLAADQLELAELRHQNGLNTVLDVLNAQSRFAAAEVEVVAARYHYNMARAAYLQAIGRGFDRWPHLWDEGVTAADAAGEEEAPR